MTEEGSRYRRQVQLAAPTINKGGSHGEDHRILSLLFSPHSLTALCLIFVSCLTPPLRPSFSLIDMAHQGKAAFADEQGGHFAIRDAPNWKVEDDEVKIKIHAFAINPADHKILVSADLYKVPNILEADCWTSIHVLQGYRYDGTIMACHIWY